MNIRSLLRWWFRLPGRVIDVFSVVAISAGINVLTSAMGQYESYWFVALGSTTSAIGVLLMLLKHTSDNFQKTYDLRRDAADRIRASGRTDAEIWEEVFAEAIADDVVLRRLVMLVVLLTSSILLVIAYTHRNSKVLKEGEQCHSWYTTPSTYVRDIQLHEALLKVAFEGRLGCAHRVANA